VTIKNTRLVLSNEQLQKKSTKYPAHIRNFSKQLDNEIFGQKYSAAFATMSQI